MIPLEGEQGLWRGGGGGSHFRRQDLLPKDAVGRVDTEAQPVGPQKSDGLGQPALAVLPAAPPPLSLGNAALDSEF